jgi:hypothetical protein
MPYSTRLGAFKCDVRQPTTPLDPAGEAWAFALAESDFGLVVSKLAKAT